MSEPATVSRRKPVTPLQIGWRILRIVLVAYLALALIVMFLETKIIFPASRYPDGWDWNPPWLDHEDVEFRAADGTRLHGWYVPCADSRAAVLFCHGNAGNITDRAEVVQHLQQRLQVSVFLFDYRGYGKSEGQPTEEGVIADARAARKWLADREGIAESEVVLLGRSLGGAVAVALAAEQPPAGLVLESTFSSASDMGALMFPFLPVRWLIRNRFDSVARIRHYRGPLLQSHSVDDEMLPFKLAKKLFDAARGKNKRLVAFRGVSHNEDNPPEYYEALDRFLDQLAGAKGAPGP